MVKPTQVAFSIFAVLCVFVAFNVFEDEEEFDAPSLQEIDDKTWLRDVRFTPLPKISREFDKSLVPAAVLQSMESDKAFQEMVELESHHKLVKDLRKQPDHFKADYSHLKHCTTCWDKGDVTGHSLREIVVGFDKQLLVDSYVVAGWHNVAQEMVAPESNRPVPSLQEHEVYFYGSVDVIADGGFRLWAHAKDPGVSDRKPVSHAVRADGSEGELQHPYARLDSEDGIHWKYAHKLKIPSTASLTVTPMGIEDCYIAGYQCRVSHRGFHKGCLNCFSQSADGGVTWKVNDNANNLPRAADSYNQYYRDLETRTIRAVWRKDIGTFAGWREIRGTQFAELNEATGIFETANENKALENTSFYLDRASKMEKLRRQLYAITVVQYGKLYLALCTVIEYPKYPEGPEMLRNGSKDSTNVYLATSRDGLTFDFDWIYANSPLVPKSPDMDAFNHGFILPAAQFADTTDKHMLYYEARGECNHERRFECKAQIGLAVWDYGRLVRVRPEELSRWGTLLTKSFTLASSQLVVDFARINNSLEAHLEVALIGSDKKVISRGAGSLKTNKIYWSDKRTVQAAVGSQVAMKIHFRHCSLFSFQFLRDTHWY
jgi:hypothetical protein